MTTVPALDDMLDLADAVAEDGVAAHRRAVDELVGWAKERGIRPVLVEVLEDPTVIDPVHQRALGHLIVAIFRWSGGDGRRSGERQLAAA